LIHPTPAQKYTIPCLLTGRSVITISPTGSGKTLAYVLPLLHLLEQQPLVAIAVVPTRDARSASAQASRYPAFAIACRDSETFFFCDARRLERQHRELPLPADPVQRAPLLNEREAGVLALQHGWLAKMAALEEQGNHKIEKIYRKI
jgi:hypothetical protein